MDIGYDPVIALNYHIALLHVRDALVEEMDKHRGIARLAVRGVGKLVMIELRRSKATMQANKTWMDERPLLDGRYRYTNLGRSSTHQMDPDTLEFYKNMVMDDIGKRMDKMREAANNASSS